MSAADADEDDFLAALPVHVPASATRVHYGLTAVEAYVRDVVERPPPLTDQDEFLEQLCAALYARGLQPPVVTIADVAHVLESDAFDRSALATLFDTVPDILPRAIKALNGDAYQLIPPEIVREAAHRERVIGGLKHGWGAFVPPVNTTSHYLLVSSGCPETLLPPYVPLPASVRAHFLDVWNGICRLFGWEPCVHAHEKRALQRTLVKEFRAADAAALPPQ